MHCRLTHLITPDPAFRLPPTLEKTRLFHGGQVPSNHLPFLPYAFAKSVRCAQTFSKAWTYWAFSSGASP